MATELDVVRVQIELDLQALAYKARRAMHVLGTPACSTPWDKLHAEIDVLLDELIGR